MNWLYRHKIAGFAVVFLALALILVTAYSGSFVDQNQASNVGRPPSRETDASTQTGEDMPAEAVSPEEALRQIKEGLHVLTEEEGGGFIANDVIHEFSNEQWDDILKVPGIRAVWSRSLSPHAWKCIGELKGLECLNYQLGLLVNSNENLECLAELRNLKVLV